VYLKEKAADVYNIAEEMQEVEAQATGTDSTPMQNKKYARRMRMMFPNNPPLVKQRMEDYRQLAAYDSARLEVDPETGELEPSLNDKLPWLEKHYTTYLANLPPEL